MNRLIHKADLVVFSIVLAGAWLVSPAFQTRAGDASSTFDTKCAMCHSKNGSGDSSMGKSMKVPDLRSKAVQSKSDTDLYNVIANGKGVMPKYEGQLSKAQINGLVTYIRHLGGKKN